MGAVLHQKLVGIPAHRVCMLTAGHKVPQLPAEQRGSAPGAVHMQPDVVFSADLHIHVRVSEILKPNDFAGHERSQSLTRPHGHIADAIDMQPHAALPANVQMPCTHEMSQAG